MNDYLAAALALSNDPPQYGPYDVPPRFEDEFASFMAEWKAMSKAQRMAWELKNPDPALDTVVNTNTKLGRNDPCHCNSGKKFKKCCGK